MSTSQPPRGVPPMGSSSSGQGASWGQRWDMPHGSMAAAQTQPTKPLNPRVQAGGASRRRLVSKNQCPPSDGPPRMRSGQGCALPCGNACLELLIAGLTSQHRGPLRRDPILLAGPPAPVPCRHQRWQRFREDHGLLDTPTKQTRPVSCTPGLGPPGRKPHSESSLRPRRGQAPSPTSGLPCPCPQH